MKYLILLLLGCAAHAADSFSDGEANFKVVMSKLMDQYVDKGVSRDELYRAATAGMLTSLNSGDQAVNKLLAPSDLKEMQDDLSGKTTGVGAVLKFDEATGHAQVLDLIPGSPAERAGLKREDDVLSVDGSRFKGKKFPEMVAAIRGVEGAPVSLRVLRDDKIISLSVKREVVPWTAVELSKVDGSTSVLNIGYFTEKTPKMVAEKLKQFVQSGAKTLIVDLRDNGGGGFTQAIETAGMFVAKGDVVASTEDRDHKIEEFKSPGGILPKEVNIIVVVNHNTFCAAELLAAALREDRSAKIVGENTFGKWDAQTVDTLPNGFAVKYTIKNFRDPHGERFQNVGLKPDLDVLLPKEHTFHELRMKYEFSKRVALDAQLKAAVALAR